MQIIVLTDNKSLTHFFQSKVIPPSLWNCLDRVFAFNIVIDHIPGRANYAANFSSRMESDRAATLFSKLADGIPVRETEIDREAQNPDVELNVLFDKRIVVMKYTKMKLTSFMKLVYYDKQQHKRQSKIPITEKQGLLKLKRKQEINSTQYPNKLDKFPNLKDNFISLNLAEEQQKD